MHRTGPKMTQALAVLPLTLAVLLVTLAIPVACFAGPQAPAPAAPVSDEAPVGVKDCGHDTSGLTRYEGHMPMPAAQRPLAPIHQHGDPGQCEHSNANQIAVKADQPVLSAGAVAVPVVVADVVAEPGQLALVLDERPSKPPGLVLTVSQLRV